MNNCKNILILLLLISFQINFIQAKDWATFRGNVKRNGFTSENLPNDLKLIWKYNSNNSVQPAWPRDSRMTFDRSHQTIIVNGILYFGSTTDKHLHALDATNGKEIWNYAVDAPIRIAPAYWKDHIFFGCDDGIAYCLNAKSGKLIWKKQLAPNRDFLLGNDHLISRWPVRGGPVIVDEKLYISAGIWPNEGIYLFALDCKTGKEIWSNKTLGGLIRGLPHQMLKKVKVGIGIQGYLSVSGDNLIAPSGRSAPVIINLKTGKLKYFIPASRHGGATVILIDSIFFNGPNAYNLKNGKFISGSLRRGSSTDWTPVTKGIQSLYYQTPKKIYTVNMKSPFLRKKVRGKSVVGYNNTNIFPTKNYCSELIFAHDKLFCGTENKVFSLKNNKEIWSASVIGRVWGLAAANKCLFVSTDKGYIYCFGKRKTILSKSIAPKKTPIDQVAMIRADKILKLSGIKKGYCLDMNVGSGDLAIAIAQKSDLIVYGFHNDPKGFENAKNKIMSLNLYGNRITLFLVNKESLSLPEYFANLIVAEKPVKIKDTRVKFKKHLRPWGGTLIIEEENNMKTQIRGSLLNSGDWTHLYSNEGNTSCSTDTLIKAPLEIFWYGGPHLDTPNRHGRSPGPLFFEGILYSIGVNTIQAIDAYNATLLWKTKIPDLGHAFNLQTLAGASSGGGNMCIGSDGLFIRHQGKCLVLNSKTGKLITTYMVPGSEKDIKHKWGYLALHNKLLIGSQVNENHKLKKVYRKRSTISRSESTSLFGIDTNSGKVLWQIKAKNSIRQNTIAIGNNTLFYIDRPTAAHDKVNFKSRKGLHAGGTLIAIDTKTGKQKWLTDKNIVGTVLIYNSKHDILIMSYQTNGYRLPSEIGGTLMAIQGKTGEVLWQNKKYYSSRPLVNLNTVYAVPYAFDILTGKRNEWNFKRHHGCGTLSGSENIMMFRSGSLAYLDILKNGNLVNYGGIRLSCWLNAIAAGGLVLIPNGTSQCSCSYLMQTNIALKSKKQ